MGKRKVNNELKARARAKSLARQSAAKVLRAKNGPTVGQKLVEKMRKLMA
jgi:hypothetical protein